MADDMKPRMDSSEPLYQRDYYAWLLDQAARLRAEDTGLRTQTCLDLDQIAEELEDMGKSEQNKCVSLTVRTLEHLFKLAWTNRTEPVPHWRSEVRAFRNALKRSLSPTIRQRLECDLEQLHREAVEQIIEVFQSSEPAVTTDADLRWTLAQILGEEDDPLDG